MVSENSTNQDRLQQLKDFDESKAGVKRIVDKGITKIPPIFVGLPEYSDVANPSSSSPTHTQFTIPVVDLVNTASQRDIVVSRVRRAAKTVGFFQVLNHGMPMRVLKEMMEAAPEFHELEEEVKSKYYTREDTRKVKFTNNFDLHQFSLQNPLEFLSKEKLS